MQFPFDRTVCKYEVPRVREIIFKSSSRIYSLDKFEQIRLTDSSIFDSQPDKEGKFETS